MTKIGEIYGGDFVKCEHLHGQEVTVQIANVSIEEVGSEDEKKKKQAVLSFAGMEKRLGCNATNANTIAGMYGDEIEAWVGKSITLFPTKCQFGPKMVDCIRIRPGMPANTTPVPVTPPEPQPAAMVAF